MMNKREELWFFNQVLSNNSIRQCMDSVENLYVDIGA